MIGAGGDHRATPEQPDWRLSPPVGESEIGSDEVVVLFHATTVSRADRIVQEGLRSANLKAEIAAVASRNGVDVVALRADLAKHQRYSHHRGDDALVYATTDLGHAESYASTAPEVEWECLWSVFRINHPDLDTNQDRLDEGQFWVTSRQAADRPVVLEFAVRLVDLLAVNGPGLIGQLRGPKRLKDSGHEVHLPSGVSFEMIARHPADRRVDGALLRYLSGVGADEIAAQVKQGRWGPPSRDRIGNWFWRWQDVIALLPDHRRRDLGLDCSCDRGLEGP